MRQVETFTPTTHTSPNTNWLKMKQEKLLEYSIRSRNHNETQTSHQKQNRNKTETERTIRKQKRILTDANRRKIEVYQKSKAISADTVLSL